MKVFKRLMSFALALLTLVSVIPLTAISARAAPSKSLMMDNHVLDAMEYIGYDIDAHKAAGTMYQSDKIFDGTMYNQNAPHYSDGKPWGFCDGIETVTDSSTKTGKAPDLATFKACGMVCASYASYYYFNYLPNIAGVNMSAVFNKFKAVKDRWTLSWEGAKLWRLALNEIAHDGSGDVEELYARLYSWSIHIPSSIIRKC